MLFPKNLVQMIILFKAKHYFVWKYKIIHFFKNLHLYKNTWVRVNLLKFP